MKLVFLSLKNQKLFVSRPQCSNSFSYIHKLELIHIMILYCSFMCLVLIFFLTRSNKKNQWSTLFLLKLFWCIFSSYFLYFHFKLFFTQLHFSLSREVFNASIFIFQRWFLFYQDIGIRRKYIGTRSREFSA